jgi:hypothetical protein
MVALTVRLLFLSGGLLLFASFAFAQGDYQRTKDGKTFVWNADPKPGDEAAWFGDRDSDGYANGVGTLTWYTTKGNVYARYFGNMVHGKFNGPVNVHSSGKTEHAIFVEGQRTTRWAVGPAPSRTVADHPLRPLKQEAVAKAGNAEKAQPASALDLRGRGERAMLNSENGGAQPPNSRPSTLHAQHSTAEPPPPAEAPDNVNRLPDEIASKPTASQNSQARAEDSLRSLVRPPSSLRSSPEAAVSPEPEASPGDQKPEAAASSEANGHLTEDEAIALADTEARVQGYHLDEYQRPKADYSAVNDKWSLFYDQRPVGDVPEIGKYFTVRIDDKTKKTSIEPAP